MKLEDIVDLPTEPFHPQRIQQLAVQCKAQRCYGSQSQQLKNEGEKNFPHFVQMDHHYTLLYTAFASGCTTHRMLPTGLKKIFTILYFAAKTSFNAFLVLEVLLKQCMCIL